MNTKVKVGIASAIVLALVALIILDQKTSPREEPVAKPPASGGDNSITVVGNSAESPAPRLPEDEINSLIDKAKKEFGEKPPKSSPPALKGSEERNEKRVSSSTNEDYVIQKDDTFETIAEKKYGTKQFAGMIAEANPGVKATALRVGKRIVLPPKPVEKKAEAAVARETLPPGEPKAEPRTEVKPEPKPEAKSDARHSSAKSAENLKVVDGQKIYTVQAGDTLSAISAKVYNTSRHYQKIYEANKDKIDDPNTLQVGLSLVMPDLPAKPASANGGGPATGVVATTGPAPAAGGKVVQVSEGTSLWKIAEKFAADKKVSVHEMIKLIVAANPDKLKDEGSLLRLGWQLVIPD